MGHHKANCGSEPARESGVSGTLMLSDTQSSRAGSLPQGGDALLLQDAHAQRAALDLAVVQALQGLLGDAALHGHIGLEVEDRDLADLGAGNASFTGQCAKDVARTNL